MPEDRFDILYARPKNPGWSVISGMVDLLQAVSGGTVTVTDGDARYSARRTARRRLPRRRSRRGTLLVVAPLPVHLNEVLDLRLLAHGYERVAAWVIDSFRDDTIPDVARSLGHFDDLFITDAELVDLWAKITRTRTSWIPIGVDALGVPPSSARARWTFNGSGARRLNGRMIRRRGERSPEHTCRSAGPSLCRRITRRTCDSSIRPWPARR